VGEVVLGGPRAQLAPDALAPRQEIGSPAAGQCVDQGQAPAVHIVVIRVPQHRECTRLVHDTDAHEIITWSGDGDTDVMASGVLGGVGHQLGDDQFAGLGQAGQLPCGQGRTD
jgi:hypothetical protein